MEVVCSLGRWYLLGTGMDVEISWKRVVVAAAPVLMQLEFQQSFLFMILEVPQIQFNLRVPDVPVACRACTVDASVGLPRFLHVGIRTLFA